MVGKGMDKWTLDSKRKRGNEEAREREKDGDGKRDGKTVGRIKFCKVHYI